MASRQRGPSEVEWPADGVAKGKEDDASVSVMINVEEQADLARMDLEISHGIALNPLEKLGWKSTVQPIFIRCAPFD